MNTWVKFGSAGPSRVGQISVGVNSYRNIFFEFLYWASRKKLLDVPMDDPSSTAIAEPGVLSINEVGIQKEFKEFLPVPSSDDIRKVMNMIAAHSPKTARRNLLMFRWASEVGLRNSEIRTLTEASLPSRAAMAAWRRDGTTPAMLVTGKRIKTRTVEPPLSLLEDTYDYLDDISDGASPSWTSQGKHIFYGSKFGPMALSYLSELFARFFALAGMDSHLHRARAYYVYRLVEGKVQELTLHGKLDELQVATILRFVADRVGHEDVKTLRHYISLAVIRLSGPEARIIED
ncbi:site-specific integrase [Roseateles sp. BYS78W]|uniref:Site-specific integrase n=1 Tax=Pelomonas candidula TaxID=3299025 RepID=A0ABW7HLR3_9BURK